MSTTVIARRVVATPVRHASEAWAVIVDLLAPAAGSAARNQLEAAAGIACALISSEALRDAPAVVRGSGPRVRIYCLFDEAAISGDATNENSLPTVPTEGDWHLSLPCQAEDLTWVQRALGRKSSRITARDLATVVPEETKEEGEGAQVTMTINEEVFLRS